MNFQLTKRIPVIFHNLKSYNSHLVFSVLHKFDVKISVITNGLEKYMAFLGVKTYYSLTVCNLSILVLINLLKICQMKILST